RLRPGLRADRRLRHGHGEHPRRDPVPPHPRQRRVLTNDTPSCVERPSVIRHRSFPRTAHNLLCRAVGALTSPFGTDTVEEADMPRGDKSKYTDKQKRKAEHIEEGYEKRGVSDKEAERRAWATVNKESGGGKKSGSGRGKTESKASSKKGGKKGGAA